MIHRWRVGDVSAMGRRWCFSGESAVYRWRVCDVSAMGRRWCFSGESAVHWCGESVMCRQYGVGGALVVSRRYIGVASL